MPRTTESTEPLWRKQKKKTLLFYLCGGATFCRLRVKLEMVVLTFLN